MGATTVWEHWDGLKPDGTMWSADMNSFNHYAYGAVGEWMFRVMAGLETSEKEGGYQHTVIAPRIGADLRRRRQLPVGLWPGKFSLGGSGRADYPYRGDPGQYHCGDPLADAGEILADGGLSFEATQEGPRALTGSGT